MAAANLRRWYPRFLLLQHSGDQLFVELALLHLVPLLRKRQTFLIAGGNPRAQSTLDPVYELHSSYHIN